MAEKKKNTFVKNVLMLMLSQIIIKVLGLVCKIAVINVEGFGNTGNGYYSTGYLVYSVLLIIASQGIPGAISKLVSNKVAIGEYKQAHKIFKVSLGVFAVIGGFFSLLLFFLSDFISTSILNVSDVTYVLKVLSPAIFFVCVSAVIRGYFAGLGTMKASSVSQALEQFFNCTLTITFVYALIGREPYVMAVGGNLSTTLAILVSFSYLILFYKRNIKKYSKDYKYTKDDNVEKTSILVKTIIMTAIPLTLGSIVSIVTSLIDNITVTNFIQIAYEGILNSKQLLEEKAMTLNGILSKVDTIINLPVAINVAFYSALVPEITSAIAKKNKDEAISKISFSILISFLIIIPCALGFIVLSDEILMLLYPNASDGGYIFQIAAVTMIFVAINHTIEGSLFGLGKMYTPAIALTVGGIIKIILNIILVKNPNINIYGAAISSFVCQVVTFVIVYAVLKKTIKFKLNIKKDLIKPLLAGIAMAIVILILKLLFSDILGNTIITLLSILIGIIVYFVMIFILKTLSKEDIFMLPKGESIYNLLLKLKVYRES